MENRYGEVVTVVVVVNAVVEIGFGSVNVLPLVVMVVIVVAVVQVFEVAVDVVGSEVEIVAAAVTLLAENEKNH